MNKSKAIQELRKYIEEYEGQYHYLFHTNFIKELFQIITKDVSGHEKEVFNILIKQFGFVNTLNTRVFEADSNEILKETGADGDYYSLHVSNKTVNLRLLMRFTEEKNPYFLAIFNEKSGKKVSDYTMWIPIIKRRYAEMKGEDADE